MSLGKKRRMSCGCIDNPYEEPLAAEITLKTHIPQNAIAEDLNKDGSPRYYYVSPEIQPKWYFLVAVPRSLRRHTPEQLE